VGVVIGIGDAVEQRDLRPPLATAVLVDDVVAGDTEHPGGHRQAAEAVVLQSLQDPQEHLRGQVLGEVGVAQLEVTIVIELRVEVLVQPTQGLLV
jgi:hypothetical protein